MSTLDAAMAAGELVSALLQLLGGGLLLYFGAQWLVAGSTALALALRIPQLIVGLTVVAYGTSTPEIIVSVRAALAGHPAVAIGNVIGGWRRAAWRNATARINNACVI